MSESAFGGKPRFNWIGLGLVLLVFAAELAAVHFARHWFGFECYRERYSFCNWARNALLASYSLAAVFALLGLLQPDLWRGLLSEAGLRAEALALNLGGLALLLASLPLLRLDLSALTQAALAGLWVVAGLMALFGALGLLAPRARWRDFAAHMGWQLPIFALAGLFAPFVAIATRPLWRAEALADQTFSLVVWIMEFWGQQVQTQPGAKIIGVEGFYINVAPSCSGIEGLVLTTLFTLIFLSLFRAELKFPHALLILPLALLTSWLLNAFRIAVLLQIGINGHPELAVGGFHSHAGWMMFTGLSLAIVLVARMIPFWLNKDAVHARVNERPAFFADPVVALIFPFAVFMASALLSSTFSASPALWYPLRALAMAIALALVWRYIRALPWRLDPLALAVGAAIAVMWIVTFEAVDVEAATPFAPLAGAALAFWIIARVIGTALLVPVIEELFFRGYLMDRIAPQGAALWRTVLAVAITSALFAALHDRWVEAGIAGVLFAVLTLRSRNLTDAIVAHALANTLIAGWALTTGNWSAI